MSERHPPGPSDWLFGIPNYRRILNEPFDFYPELRDTYGDMIRMRVGPVVFYAIFHPDLIREALVVKAKSFRRFPRQINVLRQWNGDSMLIAEGDAWHRKRRMAQAAFSPKRFAGYGAAMVDELSRFTAGWEQLIDRSPHQTWTDVIEPHLADVALRIITRILFHEDLSSQARALGEAVVVLNATSVDEMQSAFVLPDWLPLPSKRKKRAAIELLDRTIRGIVTKRRASGEDAGDLLSMLMLAVDEEGGPSLTDEQVRDEAMTAFLAGHDTTAAGLTWILYHLASLPEVQAGVASEVSQVADGGPVLFEHLPRLDFTKRMIQESLRLFPPVIGTFIREPIEPVEIGGYPLKPGDGLQILTWPVHRDPRWFPNPERFDPDRFLPERFDQLPQFAYFPFGGGPRICIGMQLAMMEMTLIVACLMRKFAVRLADGQGIPEPQLHLSVRPKNGLRLSWTRRS